jgi:hypothetical protein
MAGFQSRNGTEGLYAGTLGIFDNQLVMDYFEGNSRKPSDTVGEFQSVGRINQKPTRIR